MKRTGLLIIFILFFCSSYGASKVLHLNSPDKTLKASVSVSAHGGLMYSLSRSKRILIEPSELGITVNDFNWGTNVTSIKLKESKFFSEEYPIRGKHSTAQSKYMQYTIQVSEKGESFLLFFQLFNDGAAFRYQLESTSDENLVTKERSSFKIPAESTVWFAERKNSWKLKSHAGEWINAGIADMSTVSPTGPKQGKPLMIELPNAGYLCIAEAALENYSGMRFRAIGENTFQADFTEGVKGFKIKGREILTPWRVILFAKNLNGLVNSDIITNLNPEPNKQLFKDQSYIKPGKSVWSWITRDSSYMTPHGEKKFIDNAQKIGFDYTLIDEGWEKKWTDKWNTLKDLCDYGRDRNIGVWVWKRSNQLMEASTRKLFLDSVQKSGAVGIKVDFMDSEAKKLIDFDISLLKDCAERRLMVNFHGIQPPAGESRAYPNEMTREGIRGMELNIMKEGPITASHNAALPFTRFLVGHGDYTPGFFSKPGDTTWGHQFATMYLFDSPFLCMAENPATIINDENLNQIIPYLKDMPAVWDQTVVLPFSVPGKIAALAKRKDSTWYVVVINGESNIKNITIEPEFLKGDNYRIELVNDKPTTKKNLVIEEQTYNKQTGVIKVPLASNGGFVMKLVPTK